MGIWNLYFIVKLILLWGGIIGFHTLLNFLFAAALAIRLRPYWAKVTRQVIAVPLGVMLLYHDSNLPSFARVVEQLPALRQFRFAYLVELLGRFVGPREWLLLTILVLGYWIVNRWLRVTTFVLAALLLVPGVMWIGTRGTVAPPVSAQGGASYANAAVAPTTPAATGGAADAGGFVAPGGNVPPAANPSAALDAFYQKELTRSVSLPAQAGTGPDFDIIFLHICSLSQDDLDTDKLDNLPLLSRFDFVFKNFNSAASYSGPAAIRVLRATCGQPTHNALYNPAGQQCYVMNDLKQMGFTPNLLLNHDGHFDNFLKEVQDNFGMPGVKAIDNTSARIAMRSFDETPIRSDGDVLLNWLKQRATMSDKRVALYYNTISLHDGNRIEGVKLSSMESYPLRVKTLFDDFGKFIDAIQQSGRKTIVVFVPEHGAAIRGTKLQVAGMREIPLPEITHVPVAVKLIGFGDEKRSGPAIAIDTPTSYLAMAQLLSNLLATNPFAGAPDLTQYTNNLPQTAFVSANEQSTVMKYGGKMLTRGADGVWLDLKTLE